MRTFDRRAAAALAAGVLLLGACGGGGEESDDTTGGTGPDATAPDLPPCPVDALDDVTEPVEIVVWHSQTAKPGEALTQLAATYNASQDKVRVRLENQGTAYPELVAKYISSIASGELPDVLVVDDTSTQLLADSGTVLPAQACFEADGTDLSVFDETAQAYYSIDGALYPGSVGLANVVLFYNRDHFERAGLDPDDPPGTLEEMRTAAEAIKAAGVTETPVAHELGSWKTEFWLTGAGASLVGNDNGRGDEDTVQSALDNDGTRALWTWMQGMDDDGLLLAVPNDPGNIDHYLAMSNESASMMVESSSAASSIEAFLAGDRTVADLEGEDVGDVSGLQIDAGPFPGIEEPGRMQVGGDAWYVMNTGSDEEQAAAWDWVQFLNTVDSQVTMTLVASFLPWREGVIDDPRIAESWEGTLAGRWLALAQQQQVEGLDPAFPGPLIGPYDEVRDAIASAQERMLFDDQSVDDAITSAAEEIDEALQQYEAEMG